MNKTDFKPPYLCRNCGHACCHGVSLNLKCDSRWECYEYVPRKNLEWLEWLYTKKQLGQSTDLKYNFYEKYLNDKCSCGHTKENHRFLPDGPCLENCSCKSFTKN